MANRETTDTYCKCVKGYCFEFRRWWPDVLHPNFDTGPDMIDSEPIVDEVIARVEIGVEIGKCSLVRLNFYSLNKPLFKQR